MKRTIIAQKDSFTITLPKKWVDERNLKGGDEIEVCDVDGKIVVTSGSKNSKKEISINIEGDTETATRVLLTNAYRAGFDLIKVTFKTKKQFDIIKKVVSSHILGFEVIDKKDNACTIESFAEPSFDDYSSIFLKILYMVGVHFEESIQYASSGVVDEKQNEDIANKIIQYDNFCRRAITKKIIDEKKVIFYWNFFATVIHVDRAVFAFNKSLLENKTTLSKETQSLLCDAKDLFEILKNAYMKKDTKLIENIFQKHKDLVTQKGFSLLKKEPKESAQIYYILTAIRNTSHAISPLSGIIY